MPYGSPRRQKLRVFRKPFAPSPGISESQTPLLPWGWRTWPAVDTAQKTRPRLGFVQQFLQQSITEQSGSFGCRARESTSRIQQFGLPFTTLAVAMYVRKEPNCSARRRLSKPRRTELNPVERPLHHHPRVGARSPAVSPNCIQIFRVWPEAAPAPSCSM